ncbi:TetR family transcriptional regulator [Microbacterium hominis]|uniref:TetR family transcriptional regulator n=1 Tax=Microbacterium hominis TaxID=162426 RepID=UPI0009DFB322|nr:TetR family transcriptional regulator [Microbacterium hominis]
MNRRQQGMEETRQAIIEAAGAQFAAYGYEATSFSRVAEAMGKPKSAVGYHQFASKAALASAVIASQQARWTAIEAALEVPHGIERLVWLLLSTSLDARACPVAAGATRLLHELNKHDVQHPDGFDWYGHLAREFQAAADAEGIASVPEFAPELILGATFGVFDTADEVDDDEFVVRLTSLWVPLLQSFGFSEVPAAVERAVRRGAVALAH